MTDTNSQEGIVEPQNNGGEEVVTTDEEVVSVSKKDYDTLNQTLGSLKREIKDLKKASEPKDEPKKTSSKPDENRVMERLEKTILRSANISHEDDVNLAKNIAKKWNMDLEDVLVDEDFKVKLEKQQASRTNLEATSKIRGGGGTSDAKNTPEFWIAKGIPPTRAEVPDRKVRATIARAMMSSTKDSRKFYNEK